MINKSDENQLTKSQRKKTQINKITSEKGNITIDTSQIWWILGNTLKTYSNKLENPEEIDK
jgi:hypothetical protein